jgi:hypothetical protein
MKKGILDPLRIENVINRAHNEVSLDIGWIKNKFIPN